MDKSIALQPPPEAAPLCSDEAAERARLHTQVNANIAYLSSQVDAAVNRKRELLRVANAASSSASASASAASSSAPTDTASTAHDAVVAALDALVDARKVAIRNLIIEFYTTSLDCRPSGAVGAALGPTASAAATVTVAAPAPVRVATAWDSVVLTYHAHAVSRVTGKDHHTCDVCRARVGSAGSSSYRCTASCDFDVCLACVAKHAPVAAGANGFGMLASGKDAAAATSEAASSSASEAGHRLFLYMSRRLHADTVALQTALDGVAGASGRPYSTQHVPSLVRATALVRLRLGALLDTFDRAFVPRTDRVLPQANRVGAAMRLGTGAGKATLYCGRRLGRTLIPGSDGQCGPNSGPQCADCAAAPKPVVAAPTFGSGFGSASAFGAAASTSAANDVMWQCGACTLMNVADAGACAACETARP